MTGPWRHESLHDHLANGGIGLWYSKLLQRLGKKDWDTVKHITGDGDVPLNRTGRFAPSGLSYLLVGGVWGVIICMMLIGCKTPVGGILTFIRVPIIIIPIILVPFIAITVTSVLVMIGELVKR